MPAEQSSDLAGAGPDPAAVIGVARLASGRCVLLCGPCLEGIRTLGVTAHRSPGVPGLPPTREGGDRWHLTWPLEAGVVHAGEVSEVLGTWVPDDVIGVVGAIAASADTAMSPQEAGRISTRPGAVNRPRTDLAREQAGPADAFQVVREELGHLLMRPGRVVGTEFTPMFDRPLMLARTRDLPGWNEDPECEGPDVATVPLSQVEAPAVISVLSPFVPADPAHLMPWYLLTPDRRLRAMGGRVPQSLRDVPGVLTAWAFDSNARPLLAEQTPVLVARAPADVLDELVAADDGLVGRHLPAVGTVWQASGTQFMAVTGHGRRGTIEVSRLVRPGLELFGTRGPALCTKLGIRPDDLLVALPVASDWVRLAVLDFGVPVAAHPLPTVLGPQDLDMLAFAADPVDRYDRLPLGAVVAWPNSIGKPTFAVVAGHTSREGVGCVEVEVMTRSTDPEAGELPGLEGTWVGSAALAVVMPQHLVAVTGYGAFEETHVPHGRRSAGPSMGA